MPKLQDIEQFKASLKSLGDEPETLARWGESWHDMEPPPQGVPDDLAALLESGDELPGEDFSGDEPPGEEPAGYDLPADALEAPPIGDDFAAFLDSVSLDEESPPDSEPPPEEGSVAGSQDDGFELPEGFEDALPGSEPETAAPPEDDFSVPESLLADFSSLGEADEPPSEEPGIEDFSVPESLLEGLDEPLEPEALEPEALEPEPAEPAPDELETFGLDDLESLSGETPPSDSVAGDEFSIPGFDDAFPTDAPADAPLPDDDFSVPEELEAEALEPSPAEDVPEAEAEAPEAIPDMGSSFDLGSESMEGDSFDQFDLGGLAQDVAVPDLGIDDFGGGGAAPDDIDGQLAALDGDAPTSDNFSLDSGWGGDFTIPGFEMGGEEKPAPKPSKAASGASLAGAFGAAGAGAQPEKKAREVSLSDAQVDALQDTLLSYPLNLRLAIEDIVANGKGAEAQQADLVWMLVEGAQAKDAAKLASKVLKRYIEVPASFAKRTGAAFEAEKGSFRYLFMHSILPVLQVLLLVAAGAGALFYLGYTFAYRPLKANSLYSEGHRQIGLAKYGESLEFFDRADKEWSMKGWHYRYAEAYAEGAQYPRAEAMYDRLLGKWPKETKAALDYARMESEILAFPKTESVLQAYILNRDYFNKQALLASAENYLAWADFDEQDYDGPDAKAVERLYEKARLQLATLMERHGRSDAYLELMLTYFMRTERAGGPDMIREVLPLSKYFVDNSRSSWSAATLAELADYLLDRDETDNVNAILLSAVDRDGTVPEAHAAMARWNRRSGFPDDELKALEYAARFYAEADARTGLAPKRVKGYVSAMMRLSEMRRAAGRSLDAEDALNVAIDRYERAVASRQLRPEARFGRAYSLLADIYYSERIDFPGALALYDQAERNGYTSPETDYARGYMHFMSPADDGSAALRFFYRAGLDRAASPYLQWATANTLFQRKDFFAAQGYYSTLAKRLQFELDTISLPSPQKKPSHNEIVELLMMTRNNLGAALYRVAERMGDARKRADAMVEFTESARLFDALTRDQASMLRPETKNLGFLNLDFVLHPMRGIDLGIYKALPTDMAYPRR